jgi:hypothetical protein
LLRADGLAVAVNMRAPIDACPRIPTSRYVVNGIADWERETVGQWDRGASR